MVSYKAQTDKRTTVIYKGRTTAKESGEIVLNMNNTDSDRKDKRETSRSEVLDCECNDNDSGYKNRSPFDRMSMTVTKMLSIS
uniref:Uncharacterized protein n=1 Tax=Romanomermis culicivorax TaxID=13658 RepID=A0A915IJA4_ROMCU